MSSELSSELFICKGVTIVVRRCVTNLINLAVKPTHAGGTVFVYPEKGSDFTLEQPICAASRAKRLGNDGQLTIESRFPALKEIFQQFELWNSLN